LATTNRVDELFESSFHFLICPPGLRLLGQSTALFCSLTLSLSFSLDELRNTLHVSFTGSLAAHLSCRTCSAHKKRPNIRWASAVASVVLNSSKCQFGPNLWRYSVEEINDLTMSAFTKLPLY